MKLNSEADKEIRDILLEREGREYNLYKDTTKNETIGIGHKILPGEDFTTIDDAKIDELFESDLQKAVGFADTIIKEQNIKATENDRMALTLMAFQLGIGNYDEKSGVRGFTDTLKYLAEGDREAAAIEAANSKWATQTPKRLKDFQMLMRRGVSQTEDPSMYRTDGTIKSAMGWKGPIKNNITGKTMTELSIGAPNTEEGFYPLINPYTTDEQIEYLKNNNFEGRTKELYKTEIGKTMLHNARRHYEESLEKGVSPFFEDNKMKGGFIDMEDGGEVPSLTSEVLPTETVESTLTDNIPSADTVDTTQGFYASNPAPGESSADFEQRTMQYTQPVETLQKASSFKPPEDYVSPRVSTSFLDILETQQGTGTGTGDSTGGSTSVAPPTDTGLSESELAALTVLGTAGDVLAGEDAKQGATPGFTAKYWADSFNDFDPDITLDLPDILKTPDPRASAWLAETNEARAANGTAPLTMQHAEQYINLMDSIDYLATLDPAALTREMGNITVGGTTVNVFDVPGAFDKNGININAMKQGLGDPLKVFGAPMAEDVTFATNEDGSIDYTRTVSGEDLTTSPFDNIKNTIEKVGNTHLFTMQDGTYSVELKDLYDEFTAAILVGAVTGDAGKAAIAGGTQFIKSEVIESYAMKAAKAVNGFNLDGTLNDAGKAAATKWRGFGGAATSIAGVLALGGDEEAALTAGVQHLVTEFGAEKLGEMMGVSNLPGFETDALAQGAVGGAAIAAVVSFIRTGDLEQAAISGATSYLFSVNPVLGIAAMALQFLTASKPSYKSGYASFDFDEFKMNTYSQGDYDSSKANPSNVEFSKKLLDPMIPYMQELEKTTGFNFKGDLQIHYSQGKKGAGVYYTIGNRDQEGLDAKGMFLNRLDYYDGRDQSTQDGGKVYRKHFQPTQEGLEAMYESIYADLAYISENKITDLSHYTGVVKSAEEIQAGLKNTGFDMGSLSFMQDGGKIVDKTSKVLYNSNQAKNYGLVNKKGKAPPSMRADDVPMTLKEGDFVLSQPAVALYGEDTIQRMVNRASKEAGTNLKSGGKVPVNVHNGEYIIPKNLTKYIGSNVLENMNNRGLMSVGDKTNT